MIAALCFTGGCSLGVLLGAWILLSALSRVAVNVLESREEAVHEK